MHDPTTLAHRIPKLIPRIHKQSKHQFDRYGNGFHWQMRIFSKHSYISPFIYVAGYELYFGSFIEIWHTDPLGDSGPACHGRKHWRWHIHHMSIAPTFWYGFRQRHITRCAWCGLRSNKERGLVNFSNGVEGVSYHHQCIGKHSDALHAHDPANCWTCKPEAKKKVTP